MGLPSAQGDQAEDTITLLLYVNNLHAINLLHAYVMGNTARSRRPPDQAGATPTACNDIFWRTCCMDYGMGFTAQNRSPPCRAGTTLTACNAMFVPTALWHDHHAPHVCPHGLHCGMASGSTLAQTAFRLFVGPRRGSPRHNTGTEEMTPREAV